LEDYVLSHTGANYSVQMLNRILVKTKRISTIKKNSKREKSDTGNGGEQLSYYWKVNYEIDYIVKHSIDF